MPSGPPSTVIFFDHLKRGCIKHGDGTAAAESVVRLRVNRDPVASAAGDGADRLERVEIIDKDYSAARNIQPASVVVRIDIICAAGSHRLGEVDN